MVSTAFKYIFVALAAALAVLSAVALFITTIGYPVRITTAVAVSTTTVKIGSEIISVCFSRVEICQDDIVTAIDRARTRVYIMVFIFTADAIADALIRARDRGVEVKVIVDDEQAWIRGSEFQRLKDAGINIRTDNREGLMHHKVVIIDGEIVITGSYNFSYSAEDRNDENVLIIRDKALATLYEGEFNRIWEGSV